MTRPRLLDLFSCAGGAAIGYHRAGFDVVGVDIARQRRYPFEHHVADALQFLAEHGHEYDAIHASPPCQAYSITRHTHSVQHPDLVEPTRAALQATGLPYVIENVVGAPLLDPLVLCGSMFDLHAVDTDGTDLVLRRHRLFESNVALTADGAAPHVHDDRPVGGAYGGGSPDRRYAKEVRRGGYTPAKDVRAALLGLTGAGFTLHELSQALPPAYTEHVGRQVLAAL